MATLPRERAVELLYGLALAPEVRRELEERITRDLEAAVRERETRDLLDTLSDAEASVRSLIDEIRGVRERLEGRA